MDLTSEMRRCLLEMDVAGMMKVHARLNPHLEATTAADALVSMHVARCEMKTAPGKAKAYSKAWLAERGFEKHNGRWTHGPARPDLVASAVGIASKSNTPGVARKVMVAMNDALLNAMAKGINEPEMQREVMQKARMKVRQKLALA